MISQHYCGIAVEPNNPILFAKQILRLSKNRDKLSAISKNDRDILESKFDKLSLAESFNPFFVFNFRK
jgi:hypothetical protein